MRTEEEEVMRKNEDREDFSTKRRRGGGRKICVIWQRVKEERIKETGETILLLPLLFKPRKMIIYL